jgi:hypothetical protein
MPRRINVSVLATGLFVAVLAHALPPPEKIVMVDAEMRKLLGAARNLRTDELSKALCCSHPDNRRYDVPCRQYTEALPGKQAAYRKALVDVGRSLTACEDQWSRYQSLKDAAEIFRLMGSHAHYSDGGVTSTAVEWLTLADEQRELARTQYQAFKQAGCVVMRKDGLGNAVPLRPDDPLKDWS